MSKKLYEDFLVEHFCQWATKGFEGESRFQFRSPDSDNSLKLYEAMLHKADTTVSLVTDDINQMLPAITFGNTTLIPVVHGDSDKALSENFISHLRDLVSAQDGPLKDCVLLVIHNSYLDTLINSARDLGKNGEVWHPSTIKKSLSELISSISGTDKVSQCLLDHRFKLIIEDGATMFGFTELYDALDDGIIQFSELGLFNDNTIVNWDDTDQIDNRLSQNHQLYGNISEIVEKYPQELVEKLGDLDLSEKFVNSNFGDDQNWEKLDFGAIIKERRDNKENLLAFEDETIVGLGFIVRENKKERHLIIEMPADKTEFKIEASFVGGKIQKNELKLQHTKEPIVLDVNNRSQKRSVAEISGFFNNQPLYFSVDFKREKPQERFKYRVLVIPQGSFYLDDLTDSFLLATHPKKQLITLQTNAGTLKIAEHGELATVTQSNQTFSVQDVQIVDFSKFANETDSLTFAVQSGSYVLNFEVDGAVSSDTLSLPLILDTNLFNRLYNDNFNGLYNRAKEKVVIDGKDLTPTGMRKYLLNWEAKLQDERILATQVANRPEVTLDNIKNAFPELFAAYDSLFNYLDEKKALISTCSWGSEFLGLVNSIVKCYLSEVEKLETKLLLSPQALMLVNIGIAEFDEQEYLTPLHPLTLAYFAQLVTRTSDENDNSFNSLPKATIKRLNAEGLLPFIWHPTDGFAYNQAVADNRMWCKFVSNKKAALTYVRPLVRQKVSEFTKAFDVLFDKGGKETVYINSINNGNNTSLFLGLVDYLKKKSLDEANRIHVNIYDKELQRTYFDDFADAPSYDELKNIAELGSEKDKADAIADMLKSRITYSKFRLSEDDPIFKYAHVSFVRNDTTVEPVPVDVLSEKTGVACHGLLAGETAYQEQNTYFTTFGLNKLNVESTSTLKLSSQFNSLAKAAWCGQKYETNNGLALKVAGKLSELLDSVYENSVWTIIIDPKVTLDFFKGQKDTVLIHYSDNFTNSANYDAITVTKRRDLYDQVLSQGVAGLTDEFNAFNGEWLLKMITSNDNDRKEKKSIIGAYKYVNCLLHQSDITWVPMSVAEMIRVAGNIGLKMSDSDFSRYSQNIKSGAISDDVLFVGFKGTNMYLLPLEVKIGKKRTHSKGIQQAKELKRYLIENLFGRDDLAGHLYRGLFIRQVLMQVDKFELYKVYEGDYFSELQNNREWWLQGDYQIADVENYPQGFMMAFFENADFAKEEFMLEDNILQIILPSANLNRFISTPLQDLFKNIKVEYLSYIDQKYILNGAITPIEVIFNKDTNDSSTDDINKPIENEENTTPKPANETLVNTKVVEQEKQNPANQSLISTKIVEQEKPNSDALTDRGVEFLISKLNIKISNKIPKTISYNIIKLLISDEVKSFEIDKIYNEHVAAYKDILSLANKTDVLSYAKLKSKAKEEYKSNYVEQLKLISTELGVESSPTEIKKKDILPIINTVSVTESTNKYELSTFLSDTEEASGEFKFIIDRIKQAKGRTITIKELLALDESWFIRLHRVQLSHLRALQRLQKIYKEKLDFTNEPTQKIEPTTTVEQLNSHRQENKTLTPQTLVSDLVIPQKCLLIIEILAKFYNKPLIVNDLLTISTDRLEWKSGVNREMISEFKSFKKTILTALNSLSHTAFNLFKSDDARDNNLVAEHKTRKADYLSDNQSNDSNQHVSMKIEPPLKSVIESEAEPVVSNKIDNQDIPVPLLKEQADIPKEISVEIHEWAKTAYFDDPEMFNIFVSEQNEGYLTLLRLNFDNVPNWSLEAIKDHAANKYAEDYAAQVREIKRQVKFFIEIDSLTLSRTPEQLREFKQQAREEYPGNYSEQLSFIKRQLDLSEKYSLPKKDDISDEEKMETNLLPTNLTANTQIEASSSKIVTHSNTKDSLKVLVGHVIQNNEPVYWEPTNTAKFMNTNSGIIGTMGTGKTQCTKSVVTQLYRNQHNNVDGKPIGILIFDYKSDYVDDKFIKVTNGKKFNLHKLPYNPLSLFGDTPMLPVHTARGFSETMGKAFNLGTKQQLKLRKLIGDAYDLAGIHKANKSTWSKAAPTMADLWSLFLDSDPAEDSLYAALESICELEIFEDDTSKCMSLYDLVDGITVVELAGYPGEIQNLVVALTLDLFYSQMQKQGKPEVQGDFRQVTKLVLVDEADNFMSQNFPSLRKILKEGREYGVGVILSTQDITHFKTSENDYSAYILSWIVHRVAQIKTQDIKGIFNKDDKSEQELLMKNIRELEKHTSLYIDGEKQIKRIKDKAFWELLNDE
ncbi:DNA phosphorothioation-dependent restriction protein DptH [Pseudoalteromonas sp. SR44-2]|uniref:DNA phosphorothioation-dependent restriction protein DptH n=2 Tax=unclassified Pseudoalteromonas TaxID=194690 RepID=UPI00160496EB|nr:DNA phosphorothioation-dependent restriction protein DptH [Pseudoalteromonas sp. SR44-2]MBB1338849.1 DNA phosphorothioation-dependent restriction protein DptH [Pseudoalteromonas sp. SR44-2]